MASLIVKKGTVVKVLPDAKYRVVLDNGFEVLTYATGRIRKSKIRIMKDDIVKIEVSGDDFTRGRIVERERIPRRGAPNRNHTPRKK